MKKEQKILINFYLWLGILLFICFYGIAHTKAETFDAYQFSAQLYDNVNGSLSTVTTNFSNNYWTGTIPYMGANQSGAAWGISSPIPLIQNHTYSMTVYISHECGNTVLSSYNRIGVGSSFNEAKTSYQNNSNVNENLSKVQSLVYGQGLQFAFTTSVNANYIVFPFATSVSCNNVKFDLNNITIEDLGSSGVSETTINNSLSNQTNNINSNSNNNRDIILNNQASNTQSIIDNQASTTQAIIDSSSSNTQAIIDSNKENFNTCRDSKNLLILPNSNYNNSGITSSILDGVVTSNGTATSTSFTWLTDNFTLSAGTYTLSAFNNVALNRDFDIRLSNNNGNIVYARNYLDVTNASLTFVLSETTSNLRLQLRVGSGQSLNNFIFKPQIEKGNISTSWEIGGQEVCTNKLDEAEETRKGILGKIGDLISYINPTSENFFVYKLIELLENLLKRLFVPNSTFIKNWYDDFKTWFELKLGFLATPFTLFIDFIETFLNLEETNLIINIPQINVPNFEEHILIEARTFNWGELLNSKQEFRTLWMLYLDFIDVFLILNFLGLCENKYNRIFGGDTTPYEYYTTEETYSINDETGEATNHQLRQRTTRREKIK